MSQAPYIRNILETYGEQMASGHRLRRASLRPSQDTLGPAPHSCPAHGGQAVPVVETPEEERRRKMVERVAREIIDNLLVAGAQTPVVQDITTELENTFDSRFVFDYAFMECDLQVFRHSDNGPQRLVGDEAREVLDALWRITMSKVDATML